MKARIALLFLTASIAGATYAYNIECGGNFCKVYCDSGEYAGTMMKEGDKWVSNRMSDKDKKVMIKKILKAKGPDCH